MANDITGNPWKLDTVTTGTNFVADGGSGAMKVNWNVYITQVLWSDFNGAGESVDLQDGTGRSIFKLTAGATTQNPVGTNFGESTWAYSGLRLPTLSSGRILVYVK